MLLLHRAMWKDAEHRRRRQTSQHMQAEGLSTASVNQMPSSVSPQGRICPQDLKDWDIFLGFFLLGANTLLFEVNYLRFS